MDLAARLSVVWRISRRGRPLQRLRGRLAAARDKSLSRVRTAQRDRRKMRALPPRATTIRPRGCGVLLRIPGDGADSPIEISGRAGLCTSARVRLGPDVGTRTLSGSGRADATGACPVGGSRVQSVRGNWPLRCGGFWLTPVDRALPTHAPGFAASRASLEAAKLQRARRVRVRSGSAR